MGHNGDTGTMDGVDEVSYFFARRTELTLSVDEDPDDMLTVILFDALGAEVARVGPGDPDETVTVSGPYTVELRHPRAGEAGAEPVLVFLQPIIDNDAQQTRVAVGGGAGANPADVARLKAGKDCIGCNLRGITLSGGIIFRNNKLNMADFTGATLSGVIFFGSELIGTIFDDTMINNGLFQDTTLTSATFKAASFLNGSLIQAEMVNKADFTDATFTAACLRAGNLTETTFAGATFDANSAANGSNFSGSDLASTKFLGTLVNSGMNMACGGAADAAVFSSAHMFGVTFENVDLTKGEIAGGTGISFEGSDMRGASFAGSTVDEHTNFIGTNLSDADFSGVDLSRVDLSKAMLSEGTSFAGATLSDGISHGVNLACNPQAMTVGCVFPEQTTQLFKGADLSFTNFSGSDLSGADLEGTVFTGATLDGTNLFQANLTGAMLDQAQLIGANLDFANLRGANLATAVLGTAPGSGTQNTTLRGAFMVDADLTDADLRQANLTGAHLYTDLQQVILVGTMLDSAVLESAICSGAEFSGSLTDAVFNNAQLVNTVFNGADLTNAKFDTAYLQGTDFSTAMNVTGVSLNNAAVSAMPGEWTFMEQDGTQVVFQFTATALGALAVNLSVRCPNGDLGPCCPSGDLAMCLEDKLNPVNSGPIPLQPTCVPGVKRFCPPPTPAS